MKISVVMIARNAEKILEPCIQSLRDNRLLRQDDELLIVDTGSTDTTASVAKSLGARVLERPDLLVSLNGEIKNWIPEWEEESKKHPLITGGILRSFAEARNIASQQAVNDLQFWIDTDDVFDEKYPGQLRTVIDNEVPKRDLSTLFLNYDYAHDVDGKCTTVLKRERLYDRRVWEWKGAVHEVLVPREGVDPRGAGYFQDVKSKIVHKSKVSNSKSSDIRNYLILRNAIEKAEKKGVDADIRYYFYFANACRGLNQIEQARKYYELTLEKSGSRDDCFGSAHSISTMYLTKEKLIPSLAYEWAYRAMKLKPMDPRSYFVLQHACYHLRSWQEATWWFEVGTQLPEPSLQLHAYNPEEMKTTPFIVGALTFKEMGEEESAMRCLQKLKQERPHHPDVAFLEENLQNWMAGKRLEASIKNVSHNMEGSDKGSHLLLDNAKKVVSMVKSVPTSFEDVGASTEPHDKRVGKDLVFFCGKTMDTWGPKSASRGLGGSERAVYEIAKRLQGAGSKRGFRVTVYCSCPKDERGITDGVLWRHYGEFDKDRPRGTIVYWRSPQLLELPFSARKRIVWCHDVQNPQNWTKKRVALLDKVFVLSKYHKTTLGHAVPLKKILVTRNGIDVHLLRSARERFQKNPRKVIYTSSPDRGLLTALRIFKQASKMTKGLEFHAFYGFSDIFLENARDHWSFYIPDVAGDVCAQKYMRDIHEEFESMPNAAFHGRTNWEKMAQHFAEAGVWLYPTRFDEISCISAMEAQAAGCCVVATDKSALKETVLWDEKVNFKIKTSDADDVATCVALASKISSDDPLRERASERALEKFSWDSVAEDWRSLLDPDGKS